MVSGKTGIMLFCLVIHCLSAENEGHVKVLFFVDLMLDLHYNIHAYVTKYKNILEV